MWNVIQARYLQWDGRAASQNGMGTAVQSGVRSGMKRVALLTAFVLVAMVAALAPPETPTQAQANCFPQTNFCISNPAFAEYFRLRGDVRILGYPISRSFTLEGFEVQFFQRVILQLQGGQVNRLNVLDPSIMPKTD